MAAMKYAQRQLLARIVPKTSAGSASTTAPAFPNLFYFAQVSGGEITAAVEKIYVGGAKFPELLCAPSEVGDVTITAHYDDAMRGTLNEIRTGSWTGRAFYNITIFYMNCDVANGKPDRQYNEALLVGISEPDGDSSSGAPATFALTFSINGRPSDLPTN